VSGIQTKPMVNFVFPVGYQPNPNSQINHPQIKPKQFQKKLMMMIMWCSSKNILPLFFTFLDGNDNNCKKRWDKMGKAISKLIDIEIECILFGKIWNVIRFNGDQQTDRKGKNNFGQIL
jgi:hypothetical protein